MTSKYYVLVTTVFLLCAGYNAQADSSTVSEEASAADVNKNRSKTFFYWTRDSIAKAPGIMMIDKRKPIPFKKNSSNITTNTMPMPTSTAGGSPSPDSNTIHRQAYGNDWKKLETEFGTLYLENVEATLTVKDSPTNVLTGTESTYINYDVNTIEALWKIHPHKWIGRLTFTTPSGDASCSATAISNNHIVTAAHCVFDTPSRNAWYTNKAFTPAYRNGAAPYGTFPVTSCRVLADWKNLSGSYNISTWARYDVAVCNVDTNSIGKTLNAAVGWAGRSWDNSYEQVHFNAGYPANDVNDEYLPSPAQYLRACTAESFQQATDTLGSGCFYGRGISGGPWLKNYAPFQLLGKVNSVNSGLFIGQHNLYGARFTSSNIKVLCDAEGC
ncbi:MAG: trypsin-like serine protease [Nitrosomonas sp.]|nr:trypsin-like serine protease [Nitrosomonas sp.]